PTCRRWWPRGVCDESPDTPKNHPPQERISCATSLGTRTSLEAVAHEMRSCRAGENRRRGGATLMFGYYLVLALRSLKRNKALTALMILAIAAGIGASMTTLTVMHVLSGDPLPGRSATIFYPQVNPNPDPAVDHGPYDVLDYRSAFDLWSAHRADRQA